MDKKLTKEDIINAAKCCTADNYCGACPLINRSNCITDFMKYILEYMENEPAPTADVQEARHGKWEATELMYENGCTRCSECKTEYYASDLEEICGDTFPTYCPLCGARMDGDSL